MDEANEIIEHVLNQQSKLLWKWREKLVVLLTQPLTSGDSEDADGQEYNRGLETQGEAEAYLHAYTNLLADRRETMTSERTLLATLDVQEKKQRKTKAARKALQAIYYDDEVTAALADIDQQPEHEVLQKTLLEERKELVKDMGERSIKSVRVILS